MKHLTAAQRAAAAMNRQPREPVFGPGAPEALAYALAWIITFLAVQWVIH